MATELITENIWNRLTDAVKNSKGKSTIAVAYFSKGAASMLPLTKGSILLVDSSLKAVSSGQTCPAELLKLYYKGVKIYSKDWLHAKMFVIGNSLYIGSTNASNNSSKLTEAIIKSSDKKLVEDAKQFINSFCKVELGEEQLNLLQKKYKEPRFIGPGGKSKKAEKQYFQNSSTFFIYHLVLKDYTPDEEVQSEIGNKEVVSKRIVRSRHCVEEFNWKGNFPPKKNDIVIQVVNEGNKTYVSPPGIVIHLRRWIHKGTKKAVCFLEVPIKKRKSIEFINDHLSKYQKVLFKRNGRRNKEFGDLMNNFWKK